MLEKPIFQVSECIEAVNNHLSLLGEIIVEGELSRWDLKNNRLIFGALKDSASAMDIFTLPYMVKNFRQFEPGMLVRAYGSPGLYKGSGKFRFYVRDLVPVGEGALKLAFEKLKQQLGDEGLFAPERKRPLPTWPQKIGLITAPGSSAQADLLKILTARMGNLHLMTLPVNVQGREAVPSLLRAFSYVNLNPSRFDVIIMARGGGSLEDLAAFNSEEVCRAVFGSKVPIICAIGHEDNWSLCDFVADVRASTPSNAAELAVRDRQAVLSEVSSHYQLIYQRLLSHLSEKSQNLNQFAASFTRRLQNLKDNISQTLPLIHNRLNQELTLKKQSLVHLERLLQSLDYQAVLKRGYSITTLKGLILKSAAQVKSGDTITTQLADNQLESTII